MTDHELQLLLAATGPLLALIPILAWELSIKPRKDVRELARSLRVEIELLHAQLTAYASQVKAEDAIMVVSPVSTEVYRNVIGRIGELPGHLAQVVIQLYSFVEETNESAREFNQFVGSLMGERDCAVADFQHLHLQGMVRGYHNKARYAIAAADVLLPRLTELANSRWLRMPRRPALWGETVKTAYASATTQQLLPPTPPPHRHTQR